MTAWFVAVYKTEKVLGNPDYKDTKCSLVHTFNERCGKEFSCQERDRFSESSSIICVWISCISRSLCH